MTDAFRRVHIAAMDALVVATEAQAGGGMTVRESEETERLARFLRELHARAREREESA